MSSAYLGTASATSDHDVTLTLAGEVESLRPRLLEAMQKLGYTVISEQPLYGKRNAKGGARWDCSFEVIDYPRRLTISLKQVNQVAVIATFSFEIKSYKHMTKGDRQTLVREAEAIAAVASERFALSACPSCATPVTDDSHFCRRCGAPLVIEVAELEVYRLTAASRTAYHNLFIGVICVAVAALLWLPLFWVEAKLFNVLLLFGSMAGAFGLFALLQGMWQLHFSLNPKQVGVQKDSGGHTFSAPQTQALPRLSQASVTEGTTELLIGASKTRTPEVAPRKSLDTGEVDERLM